MKLSSSALVQQALSSAEYVVEAVPEEEDLKKVRDYGMTSLCPFNTMLLQ